MAKQLVNIDGEDVMVREDTAKRYRGVHWAVWSLLAFIVIAAALFFAGVFKLASNRVSPQGPANAESRNVR
jgi:hypothetical protein